MPIHLVDWVCANTANFRRPLERGCLGRKFFRVVIGNGFLHWTGNPICGRNSSASTVFMSFRNTIMYQLSQSAVRRRDIGGRKSSIDACWHLIKKLTARNQGVVSYNLPSAFSLYLFSFNSIHRSYLVFILIEKNFRLFFKCSVLNLVQVLYRWPVEGTGNSSNLLNRHPSNEFSSFRKHWHLIFISNPSLGRPRITPPLLT